MVIRMKKTVKRSAISLDENTLNNVNELKKIHGSTSGVVRASVECYIQMMRKGGVLDGKGTDRGNNK